MPKEKEFPMHNVVIRDVTEEVDRFEARVNERLTNAENVINILAQKVEAIIGFLEGQQQPKEPQQDIPIPPPPAPTQAVTTDSPEKKGFIGKLLQ